MTISTSPTTANQDHRVGDIANTNSGLLAGRGGWGDWLVAFLLIWALYILTLAPDIVWQDQGDYQYQAAKLNLNRPGDVVRVHPLFIVVAHGVGRVGLFSYAYAANLVSSLFSAIAAANVYLLLVHLTQRRWPALLGAACFAMAHSQWFLAVQAQTYGMANAALSASLVLMLAYLRTDRIIYLLLIGLLSGLGISAHMMSQIGFAVIMAYLLVRVIRGQLALSSWLLIILFWVVGATLLWLVMAIEYKRTGDLSATLLSAVYGKWSNAVFNLGRIGVLLKKSVLFFVLNFPTPLVLLAIPGLYCSFRKLKHRCFARLLVICTVFYAMFAVRYDVPNQNNFFLPMYMLVAVYIGLGFASFSGRHNMTLTVLSAILLLALPATYLGMASLARGRNIALGTRRHVQYRDDYSYYLLPWQHNQTGPRRLATELFEQLPADSILICDSTAMRPLLYVNEIEGKGSQVSLVNPTPFNEELRDSLQAGRRFFTLSDVEAYRPAWVEDKDWLHPFTISDTEHIFEIIVPSTSALRSSQLEPP